MGARAYGESQEGGLAARGEGEARELGGLGLGRAVDERGVSRIVAGVEHQGGGGRGGAQSERDGFGRGGAWGYGVGEGDVGVSAEAAKEEIEGGAVAGGRVERYPLGAGGRGIGGLDDTAAEAPGGGFGEGDAVREGAWRGEGGGRGGVSEAQREERGGQERAGRGWTEAAFPVLARVRRKGQGEGVERAFEDRVSCWGLSSQGWVRSACVGGRFRVGGAIGPGKARRARGI